MDIMARTAIASVNDVKKGVIGPEHEFSYEWRLQGGTVRRWHRDGSGWNDVLTSRNEGLLCACSQEGFYWHCSSV